MVDIQVFSVKCHMSPIMCFLSFFLGQINGASQWRVCYQRSLPRLVYHVAQVQPRHDPTTMAITTILRLLRLESDNLRFSALPA